MRLEQMRTLLCSTLICVSMGAICSLEMFAASYPQTRCTSLLNQGRKLLKDRKLRKAQDTLEEAGRDCASMPDVYATLALSYDLQDEHRRAQQAYRKAIALNPNVAMFHDNLGLSYAASGDEATSIAEFEKALRIDPHDQTANLNLARYFLRHREFSRAVGYFRAAGVQQSTNLALLLDLTTAYFGANRISAARETAARVSTLAGSHAKVHFSLGLLLARNGQYELAAVQFVAVPSPERDFATYMDLGMVYSKLLQFQKARNAYESALQLNPSSPEPYLHIGLDAAARGEKAQAVNWISQAFAEASEREDVAYVYAEALIQSTNFDRARNVLIQALQIHPNSPELIKAQGDLYMQQNENGRAKQAYLRCLKINPHFLAAQLSLAQIYLRMRQPRAARRQLERVLQVQPKNPVANSELGRMDFDLGRQTEAQRMTETALKEDPNNRVANETLAEIEIRKGNYSKASTILERLVKLNPQTPRFHYLLGRVLVKLGRLKEAQREFETSRHLQNAPVAQRPMVSNKSQ